MKNYLNANFINEFIKFFKSFAEAPVLFIFKKNKGLRLCINYKGLNNITKKNRYFLFLIKNILDRISGAKIFTKINIKNVYYRIRIREDDE